jgi:hypothetical protein
MLRRQFWHSSVVTSPEWVPLIWELLIAYANADRKVPSGWNRSEWTLETAKCAPAYQSPFDRTAHMMLASGAWAFCEPVIAPDFDPNRPELLEHLRARGTRLHDPHDEEVYASHVFRRTSKELKDEHRDFRRTLKWLCSLKAHGSDRREVERHLRKFGIVLEDRLPTAAKDRPFLRYLETHGVLDFKRRPRVGGGALFILARWKHAIDPFCAFLLEQCAGKTTRELPIRICARPECDQFFMFARNTAEFCSDSCRTRSFWTPKKRREYMRNYRKIPIVIRRRKLKQLSKQLARKA